MGGGYRNSGFYQNKDFILMNKKIIFVLILLLSPILLILGFILFLTVYRLIPDSDKTIFYRVTRNSMPQNISNFKVHHYFLPVFGDGFGIISFDVPQNEGLSLIKNSNFGEKTEKTYFQNVDRINIRIERPVYYFKSEDIFNRFVIKSNQESTRFIWEASF